MTSFSLSYLKILGGCSFAVACNRVRARRHGPPTGAAARACRPGLPRHAVRQRTLPLRAVDDRDRQTATPGSKPLPPSSWMKQRAIALLRYLMMSGCGTFRTSRDVRPESGMRTKADLADYSEFMMGSRPGRRLGITVTVYSSDLRRT